MLKVTKKIDDLGRVAIPREMRKAMELYGGDEIDIVYCDDNTINIFKHEIDFSKRMEKLKDEISDRLEEIAAAGSDEVLETVERAIELLQNLQM